MKLSFAEGVYRLAKKIPKGKVSTYKDLANALGNPKAVRAVGNALNKNPFAPKVPCHRVIKSDGSVGGFASGTRNKIKLLRREGIILRNGKINLKKFCFKF